MGLRTVKHKVLGAYFPEMTSHTVSTWQMSACLLSDSTQRSLRSADVPTCVVLRTLSSISDRSFAAAGPRLWNSIPVQLRNPDITYGLFGRQLKGHLFREAWTRRPV